MKPIVERQSDMVLVERYQFNGDELAFAELTRRYADHVYSTCLRILGDAAQAEDATQETFFKLLKQPRQVRESIGGWLHRVATRLAIDRIRQDARRRSREREYTRLDAARKNVALATWDDLAPHIDAALDALPQAARDVLVAHFLHDRTLTDLAAEHRVSKATMSRRCRDAMEKLRGQLSRRGVTASASALGGVLTTHTVEAAPTTVGLALRKMALAGSATPAATGAAATGGSPVGAWWALALIVAGVAGGCVLIALSAHRSIPTVSGDPRSAVAPITPAPSYLAIPGGETHLRGDRIALFQHPESATDGRIGVVFGDGRVVTLTVDEARAQIEKQTGRTLADLLPTLPTAAP